MYSGTIFNLEIMPSLTKTRLQRSLGESHVKREEIRVISFAVAIGVSNRAVAESMKWDGIILQTKEEVKECNS
jgi:hypothetical protein